MANLKDLISKGTEESLKKLTDEQLGEQQLLALQHFVIISVKQAAIFQEQLRRGLTEDDKFLKEYIGFVGEKVKEDQDLFCLNEKEGS